MKITESLSRWLFVAGILLLALLVFHPLLVPDQCLFTTDDNLGMMPAAEEAFPSQLFGHWGDQWLYGGAGGMGQISWTPIMMGILPMVFAFNWIHAIDLVLASIFLWLFLRRNNLSLPAIALGVLTAYWLGSNLTLVYAGHIAKFTILMMATAVLVCLKQVKHDSRNWCWCVIAGGIMGLMFIEQQDVALFFNMFLGLYAVFHFSRVYLNGRPATPAANFTDIRGGCKSSEKDGGTTPTAWQAGLFTTLKRGPALPETSCRLGRPNLIRINVGIIRVILLLAIIPCLALLVSSTTLLSAYIAQVKSVSPLSSDTGVPPSAVEKEAKWQFVTQWSWPPDESIDFIAPGYMGWRSGESDGPYWGRMGRSAEWEKTGQGFMNFKLENQYLGAIPLIFAIFAVVIAVGRRDFRKTPLFSGYGSHETSCDLAFNLHNAKAEIYFWFFAAVLALLLSFGKYFPLYALFYQLPLVSEIRNPNKFLQIFQLAVGILTAYGAHFVFNWKTEERGKGAK